MDHTERYLFIDIETTGLDVRNDYPLEFGALLTDKNFTVLDTFHTYVWSAEIDDRLDDLRHAAHSLDRGTEEDAFVHNMHIESNLLRDMELSVYSTPAKLDELFEYWITKNNLGMSDPVCGSSVGFDRNFMAKFTPKSNEALSYRNIDVSSFKELAVRIAPQVIELRDKALKPARAHRVLDDIHDSINELKFYMEHFVKGAIK